MNKEGRHTESEQFSYESNGMGDTNFYPGEVCKAAMS